MAKQLACYACRNTMLGLAMLNFGRGKVLKFPRHWCLGRLYTHTYPEIYVAAAQGTIRVSRNVPILLRLLNSITKLFPLRQLNEGDLSGLSLAYSSVNDDELCEIAGLAYLNSLEISETGMTGRGLQWLSHLIHLQVLEARRTCFDDDAAALLGHHRNLTSINLSSTYVGDLAVERLISLPNLSTLTVSENRITNRAGAALGQMQHLKTLDLSGTRFGSAGVRSMKAMQTLQTIRLDRSEVDDAAISELSGFGKLEEISVGSTIITDRGAKALAGCASLKRLCLARTKITDAAIHSLNSLENLEEIDLSFTSITERGIQQLAEFPALRKLVIGGVVVPLKAIQILEKTCHISWSVQSSPSSKYLTGIPLELARKQSSSTLDARAAYSRQFEQKALAEVSRP